MTSSWKCFLCGLINSVGDATCRRCTNLHGGQSDQLHNSNMSSAENAVTSIPQSGGVRQNALVVTVVGFVLLGVPWLLASYADVVSAKLTAL